MEAWEYGLIDHAVNEALSIPNAEKCFAKKEPTAKDVPIKLVDLTGAFLILGIGLGAAILCFLIELIVAKYRHETKLMKQVVEEKSNLPPLPIDSADGDVSIVTVEINAEATEKDRRVQSTKKKLIKGIENNRKPLPITKENAQVAEKDGGRAKSVGEKAIVTGESNGEGAQSIKKEVTVNGMAKNRRPARQLNKKQVAKNNGNVQP